MTTDNLNVIALYCDIRRAVKELEKLGVGLDDPLIVTDELISRHSANMLAVGQLYYIQHKKDILDRLLSSDDISQAPKSHDLEKKQP